MAAWRVDGKVYDITNYSEDVRTNLYKRWHGKGATIECLCNQTENQYPLMHIKKSSRNVYFPANNASNSKKNIEHSEDCTYNTLYRNHLGSLGINVLDDGTIECTLKDKKQKEKTDNKGPEKSKLTSNSIPGIPSVPKSALRFLFLTLIQKYEIHTFKPEQERNIDKRLYKACCETVVNKTNLKSVLYLTNEKFKYHFKKHQFIVGWGRKDQYQKDGKFISIPMYSLAEPTSFIYEHKVPQWIFEEATFTKAAVSTGYWVIWRDKDSNGILRDKEIIFVPAEENTMIPIDSSLEEKMLKYLMSKQISFKKPQIMSVGDDLLPDFILTDNKPNTIIEVAGLLDNEGYEKRLREKEQHYKNKGLHYIEWDGKEELENLVFN
ncbi:hypothetical protein [Alkalihalobacillus sp. BA299]|uniref:hypothetical protein n=1 Tax=Alkalihalobacillus sp. BA299 TaxID=2815938 RepID=UPI001ADB2E4A|nr:hypothetical protein [Alkalihalobacillus sp. BA299]